jgi:hypothetical protein
MHDQLMLTRKDVAQILGVSLREVDRIGSCNKLQRIKLGRMTKFYRQQVMELVEEIHKAGRRTWAYHVGKSHTV